MCHSISACLEILDEDLPSSNRNTTTLLTTSSSSQALQQRQSCRPSYGRLSRCRVGPLWYSCQLHFARLHADCPVSHFVSLCISNHANMPCVPPIKHPEDPRRQPRPQEPVDLSHPSGQDGFPRGPHGPRHFLTVRRGQLCHRRGLARRRRLHCHLNQHPQPPIFPTFFIFLRNHTFLCLLCLWVGFSSSSLQIHTHGVKGEGGLHGVGWKRKRAGEPNPYYLIIIEKDTGNTYPGMNGRRGESLTRETS